MCAERSPLTAGHGDGGQAAIELALSLPLVLLVILALVQVAVVARDRLAVELAAREAVRAAAVSADPATAARLAVERVTTLDPVEVTVSQGGDTVTVTVRTVNPTDVPLIGSIVPGATITATATMAWEPP
jgi:Flp pilus assembly protein TadG